MQSTITLPWVGSAAGRYPVDMEKFHTEDFLMTSCTRCCMTSFLGIGVMRLLSDDAGGFAPTQRKAEVKFEDD